MHPLNIDSMEWEARIIVLVKDGEIGRWTKLKQAIQGLCKILLARYTLINATDAADPKGDPCLL